MWGDPFLDVARRQQEINVPIWLGYDHHVGYPGEVTIFSGIIELHVLVFHRSLFVVGNRSSPQRFRNGHAPGINEGLVPEEVHGPGRVDRCNVGIFGKHWLIMLGLWGFDRLSSPQMLTLRR